MKLVKIVSTALLAGLLSTSLQANESDFYVGYSSGTMDNEAVNGTTVGWAMRMDTKHFQNSIGFEGNLFGKNDNASDGSGNTGVIFLSSGYKVSENLIPYALVGYAFQDLGTSDDGTSNMATGLAYGAGIKYKFSKSFGLDVNYKTYSLEDVNNYQYDVSFASASLIWTFNTFK